MLEHHGATLRVIALMMMMISMETLFYGLHGESITFSKIDEVFDFNSECEVKNSELV